MNDQRNDLPDLSRTEAAIAAYDDANTKFQAEMQEFLLAPTVKFEPQSYEDACVEFEAAKHAVGEAFALDTADRNDPETARMCLPGPWLRNLVAEWRLQQKGKNDEP